MPGSQPPSGSITARSTAHRPETRRIRAHFAARTRSNFLSFGSAVFTAAVGSGAYEAEAAKALIKFLAAPEAGPVLKAQGLERAAP